MRVTTTHDPLGGGRPRLIFVRGDATGDDFTQAEFDLLPGVTVIGSDPGSDLVLAGLDSRHAEVRRDSDDEYLFVDMGAQPTSLVNGKTVSEQILRTGSRIELGPWVLTYFREEFADHGRPYGGRQGGEGSIQRTQEPPRSRGTTQSGSERTAADTGEYF